MKKNLLTLLLLFLTCQSFAYDVCIDGIYYNLISKAKTAEVTKGDTKYSGNVSIPSAIDIDGVSYNVTKIDKSAFWGCFNLSSVNISNGVSNIGASAFMACSGLSSITIPNSVTSIESLAFSGCSSLASITIPNSVLSIELGVFCDCTSLTSITLPNSITSISDALFQRCYSLATITIPNSVTKIGSSAFEGCSSLSSITIPSSVSEIGMTAFSDCSSLTTITIPSSVTRIFNDCFAGCTGLTSITIPSSVTRIDDLAFSCCKNLETVTCYAENVPKTESNAFKDSYVEYCTLIVPEASLGLYKSKTPWSEFGTFKTIAGGTSIELLSVDDFPFQLTKEDNVITLSGVKDGDIVTVYSTNGKMVTRTKACGNSLTLELQTISGKVAIICINGYSIKVLL